MIDKKREKEKKLVRLMIQLYCKGKKHGGTELCRDCENLLTYSHEKIDYCPCMETKTFCSNCRVHCYIPLFLIHYRGDFEVWNYRG